jgi:hypothetical protein
MMTNQLTSNADFDYAPFSPKDRRTLIKCARDWHKAEAVAVTSYFHAAQAIAEARENLDDSKFSRWAGAVCFPSRGEAGGEIRRCQTFSDQAEYHGSRLRIGGDR